MTGLRLEIVRLDRKLKIQMAENLHQKKRYIIDRNFVKNREGRLGNNIQYSYNILKNIKK